MTTLSARFTVGAIEVAALSDGVGLQAPGDWFPGVPDEQWMEAVGATDASAGLPVNFGSFLVRSAGQTMLIDTGNGERTRGQHEGAAGLLDRIAELGVTPADIETVVLTHFHGDHVGWNVREDGAVTFPHADFYLHEADIDYLAAEGAPRSAGADFSRAKLWPLRDGGQLRPISGEYAVTDGVTMIPTPGHTPGHCSVLISSQGEKLLIAGDAAPSVAHLEHPEWTPVFDLDGPAAVQSRRDFAERAIRERALVTGGHFPIPTLGRLHRLDAGYRWEAVELDPLPAADG